MLVAGFLELGIHAYIILTSSIDFVWLDEWKERKNEILFLREATTPDIH